MKFTCNREDLLDAINKAEKAVAAKSVVSVMEGMLLETAHQMIRITGNDLSLAIEATLEADIIESGKIVLNTRMFSEIIRKTGTAILEKDIDAKEAKRTDEEASLNRT